MARRKPLYSGSGIHVPDGLGGYLDAGGVGMATRIQDRSKYAGAVSSARKRIGILASLFGLAFVLIAGRLIDVTIMSSDQTTVASYSATDINRVRADIVDRNGVVLATNLMSLSLYADTREVWDVERTVAGLTSVLSRLDADRLRRKLSSGSHFIELARRITPREKQQIFALGLPGIYFPRKERRYYPRGHDAAHVLGYVDIDNKGIAGVEKFLDAEIVRKGQKGGAVTLALDTRVQHILRTQLKQSIDRFHALAGAGVVLDVNTGEVVALASLPDFDPNVPLKSVERARFNQVTKGVYELGSVFKTFTVAMALDSGNVRLTDGYDTTRPLQYGRFQITDFHGKNRWLSVPEILIYSSNIGTVKMARDVGTAQHQEFLRKLSMYDPMPVELPEVSTPKVPDRWRDIRAATISFGHGIAVSPLHVANAAAALVNGGRLHQPTVVKRDPAQAYAPQQVLSPATSQIMRKLLRMVVTDGTGGNAEVDAYAVGGKTGTAEKSRRGGYARRALISSFLATFPTYDPQYVVFVMLDEPKGIPETHGYATAGWTAAPLAAEIIRRSGPVLGVMPRKDQGVRVQQAALSVP